VEVLLKNCLLNLIEEISMAYLDVDKDIRYYTDPLEERIDELEDKLKSQMIDVDDDIMGLQDKLAIRKLEIENLNDKLDDLLKLLKTIGD
jgi:uncharacterized coiled-coil protein SlyX